MLVRSHMFLSCDPCELSVEIRMMRWEAEGGLISHGPKLGLRWSLRGHRTTLMDPLLQLQELTGLPRNVLQVTVLSRFGLSCAWVCGKCR